MTNSTWRRCASRFTSFITGKRPYAPVPITSRWHFQGIFSSMDNGVGPSVGELGNSWILCYSKASHMFGHFYDVPQ
jgi:hypothetical protein